MVHLFDFASFAATASAFALAQVSWSLGARAGYVRTGEGIKVGRVSPEDTHLYFIRHEMTKFPPVRTRRTLIDADVDKRFTIRVIRDLEVDSLRESFRDAFLVNGCTETAKIRAFLSVFSADLRAGGSVTVTYDASRRTTTVSVEGGRSASIEGVDFMRAAWSIWLGKVEQPSLADALVGRPHV